MVWRSPTQNGSPGFTVATSATSSARTLSVCDDGRLGESRAREKQREQEGKEGEETRHGAN